MFYPYKKNSELQKEFCTRLCTILEQIQKDRYEEFPTMTHMFRFIGVTYTNYSHQKHSNRGLGSLSLMKIKKAFPEIDMNYIITGND